MGHPNLSDDINAQLDNLEEGIYLKDLHDGDDVYIQTQNRIYHVSKRDGKLFIQGHLKYCPTMTECRISGCTWGGSMIRVGFIGVNMCLEFSVQGHPRVTTSAIQTVRVCQRTV